MWRWPMAGASWRSGFRSSDSRRPGPLGPGLDLPGPKGPGLQDYRTIEPPTSGPDPARRNSAALAAQAGRPVIGTAAGRDAPHRAWRAAGARARHGDRPAADRRADPSAD